MGRGHRRNVAASKKVRLAAEFFRKQINVDDSAEWREEEEESSRDNIRFDFPSAPPRERDSRIIAFRTHISCARFFPSFMVLSEAIDSAHQFDLKYVPTPSISCHFGRKCRKCIASAVEIMRFNSSFTHSHTRQREGSGERVFLKSTPARQRRQRARNEKSNWKLRTANTRLQ